MTMAMSGRERDARVVGNWCETSHWSVEMVFLAFTQEDLRHLLGPCWGLLDEA